MKLITFTVPCYNSAAYMDRCVETLLPAGEEAEIILVDDGSKDDTGKIADAYAEKYPNIVKVIHQENGGHGEGVNQGIRNASGMYFKVVDSDDWLDAEALQKVMQTLRGFAAMEQPVDLLMCNYVYEHVVDNTHHTVSYKSILPQDRVFAWDEIGRFPPSQLFGPGLEAHILGLRAPKGGEALLQSGQFSVQLPEGGAALFSSGVLEGGGVPGGRKLLFEVVQPVEGREVGFRTLELSGQSVQRGGISGVAGRFGLGGVQNGPQSVLPGQRGGQLEAELLGLFGPAQRLLELVQLRLGLSPGGGGGAQRLLLPGQQGAADALNALRLKDSAVLGLGPEVHGEEAVDVGGRRDDRHRAARFCQRPSQRVGTAQMARQERHGEVPALVHDHHRRVSGLALAVGRDGPHRDAHSSYKNQGLVLCKMLRRPAFQGHVSAAAAHAAGQSFRQPTSQRLAFCGEGQICPAHCPASVPCLNSVVKAGS